ncbi:mobilization protein [Erwinia sp. OLMDLW33]|nr:mobilization protein [Erwinia sp. OLMDLW33]
MNCITPDKRKDGHSSFQKLIQYLCDRESVSNTSDTVAHSDETAVRLTETAEPDVNIDPSASENSGAELVIVTETLQDGRQRFLSGDVVCETSCFSPETAALEMDAVASQSRRCKDPVYHFILSWREEDHPEDNDIFTCVQEGLKKLNMEGHQYVAAIHRDTDNVHVHVAVNRVHPVTYKSVSLWNNYDHLQQCCREMERRFGYSVDNGTWNFSQRDELVRTPRDFRGAPRAANAREIFSDKESLHGYAVREVREVLSGAISQNKMSWDRLHNTLYTRGLGLREQSGGLAIYDLLHPEGPSVKASDVHPAISLNNMVREHGEFKPAPPVYNPDRPEDGMLDMHVVYVPQLHVRDQEARRERREDRAVARDMLRARYDAYRSGWEKPDLRAGERFRQIAAHCVVAKARVRDTVRDPLMRKLMYRVAEFEKMKAMAELRLQLREERQALSDTGASRPLSWKSWVEREAVDGNAAALSQMRGWAYREKRADRKVRPDNRTPDAVVYFGAGDDAPVLHNPTHAVRLSKKGDVEYQRDGITEVVDYGDRVEVYPRSEADQETWWLAAAVTARRSGDNAMVNGEPASVNRLLDSGAVLNANNAVHRFSVGNKVQQDRVDLTESWFREKYRNGSQEPAGVPRYDSVEPESAPVRVIRDLPRP